MTDFEGRLAARLARLDAAIPEPRPIDLGAARGPAARPRLRTRRSAPLLAAAVLLLGAGAVGAGRALYPEASNPELSAALHAAWDGVGCMTPADAAVAARAALDSVGKPDWEVVARPAVDEGALCAAPLVSSTTHEVVLFWTAGADLSQAIGALGAELLDTCLSRTQARDALASLLATYGIANYDIHDGPEFLYGTGSVPNNRAYVYTQHAKHCYVSAGTGWDAEGKPWFRLWGPWP